MHSSHRSVCKLLAFRGEKPGKPSSKQNVSLRRYSVSRPNPVDINPSYYPGTPYIHHDCATKHNLHFICRMTSNPARLFYISFI